MSDLSNTPAFGLSDTELMPEQGDFPGNGRLAVRDPSTGALVAQVAMSDATGARAAVDAAQAAFPDWSTTLPQVRAERRVRRLCEEERPLQRQVRGDGVARCSPRVERDGLGTHERLAHRLEALPRLVDQPPRAKRCGQRPLPAQHARTIRVPRAHRSLAAHPQLVGRRARRQRGAPERHRRVRQRGRAPQLHPIRRALALPGADKRATADPHLTRRRARPHCVTVGRVELERPRKLVPPRRERDADRAGLQGAQPARLLLRLVQRAERCVGRARRGVVARRRDPDTAHR